MQASGYLAVAFFAGLTATFAYELDLLPSRQRKHRLVFLLCGPQDPAVAPVTAALKGVKGLYEAPGF
jgi:hypothetical protein